MVDFTTALAFYHDGAATNLTIQYNAIAGCAMECVTGLGGDCTSDYAFKYNKIHSSADAGYLVKDNSSASCLEIGYVTVYKTVFGIVTWF
jgi:hypothetical protein